ncbi:MAG: hypothetical protein KAS32_21495, partial [Candidatus Peribacteraceae bacterium]|nr:hypothetical protein [Candidatus Peribacteraceae bacterium]
MDIDKEEFEKTIANINNSFDNIKDKIGAKNSFWKMLPKELSDISEKFHKGGALSNIEIQKIRSIWLSEDPLIDENGNPFVFYIHDFTDFHGRKPNRVFHVAWCSTLERMDKEGRKKRYVKKMDLNNNDFRVDYGSGRKGLEKLPACYRCQDKMREKVAPEKLYYSRHDL